MDVALAKRAAFCALMTAIVSLAESNALSAPAPKDGCDTKCRQIPGPFIVNGGGCCRYFPDSCEKCAKQGYRCKSGSAYTNCVAVFDAQQQPWMIDLIAQDNVNGPPCSPLCDPNGQGVNGTEASKNDGTVDGIIVQVQQYECF